jgi:hypothetical protein
VRNDSPTQANSTPQARAAAWLARLLRDGERAASQPARAAAEAAKPAARQKAEVAK